MDQKSIETPHKNYRFFGIDFEVTFTRSWDDFESKIGPRSSKSRFKIDIEKYVFTNNIFYG